jgi:hypothetical protein
MDYSPVGKKLAFSMEGIWVMDLSGLVETEQ